MIYATYIGLCVYFSKPAKSKLGKNTGVSVLLSFVLCQLVEASHKIVNISRFIRTYSSKIRRKIKNAEKIAVI